MQYKPNSIAHVFSFYIDIGKRERTIFNAVSTESKQRFLNFALANIAHNHNDIINEAKDITQGLDRTDEVCIQITATSGFSFTHQLTKRIRSSKN